MRKTLDMDVDHTVRGMFLAVRRSLAALDTIGRPLVAEVV